MQSVYHHFRTVARVRQGYICDQDSGFDYKLFIFFRL